MQKTYSENEEAVDLEWLDLRNIHNKVSQKTAWSVLQAVQFSVYFFAFFLAESMVNSCVAQKMGVDVVIPVYSGGLVCTALGFLIFGYFKNIMKLTLSRKLMMIIAGIFAAAFAQGLISADSSKTVLYCAFGCLVAFGFIGGFAHYSMAYTWQKSKYLGRVVGVSAAAAVLVQFAVQSMGHEEILFILSIFISSGIIIGIAIFPKFDWVLENPLPYSRENKTEIKKAAAIILITMIMTAILSLNDSLMVIKNAQNEVRLFAGVRMFYAVGLVMSGFISDIDDGKSLPISTLIAMLLSIIAAVFLSDPSFYGLNMSLMYFYSGFYVMFFTLSAIKFAPTTHTPCLWSGIGRITRSLTAAVVVLLTSLLPESRSSFYIIIFSCLLSMILLIVFWFCESNKVALIAENKDNDRLSSAEIGMKGKMDKDFAGLPEKSGEETIISEFALRYDLTPREKDALFLLVTTEDGTQEIADAMVISRRVLQRYISSIYEKTGTKTRVGLIRKVLMGGG